MLDANTGLWQLRPDGVFGFGVRPVPDLYVLPDALNDDWITQVLALDCVALNFASSHDGRSFSLVKQLRQAGFKGLLIGYGIVLPDQARHAFQCGFDALWLEDQLVQRHSVKAWQNCLEASLDHTYVTANLSQEAIWLQRH